MIHHKDNNSMLQKNIIFLLFVLCFTTPILKAEPEQQVALELYPQWISTKDYTIQGNIGIQKVYQNLDWLQYYVKPSISYSLGNQWGLHGGLGLYYTEYDILDNNFETRPFQGISHYRAFTEKWKFTTYFRVEERFQNNNEDSIRLRLRFRSDYKFNPLSTDHSWHKVTFGVEGFKSYYQDDNYASTSIERYSLESHVTLGLERSLSEKNKIRFELAWKYKVPTEDIFNAEVNTVYFKIQYYPMWGDIWRNRSNINNIDQ